jgi:hypothetical protein
MNWFVIVVGFRWAASCDGYYENIVDCYFGVLLFSVQNFFDLSCVQAMAFLAGFMTQSLKTTFGIYGVGVVMLSLVSWRSVLPTLLLLIWYIQIILPPWPMFNKHPVKWIENVKSEESKKSS